MSGLTGENFLYHSSDQDKSQYEKLEKFSTLFTGDYFFDNESSDRFNDERFLDQLVKELDKKTEKEHDEIIKSFHEISLMNYLGLDINFFLINAVSSRIQIYNKVEWAKNNYKLVLAANLSNKCFDQAGSYVLLPFHLEINFNQTFNKMFNSNKDKESYIELENLIKISVIYSNYRDQKIREILKKKNIKLKTKILKVCWKFEGNQGWFITDQTITKNKLSYRQIVFWCAKKSLKE